MHDDFEEQMRNLLGADLEAMRQGDANDLPVEGVVEDEIEAEQNNETADEIDDDMVREPNIQSTDETWVVQPKPPNESYVSIKMYDKEEWFDALILSYQPKKKGVHKDWVNVHAKGEDNPRSINWTHVASWKHKMPSTRELRLTREQMMDQEVVDAKSKEHDNLIRNNFYTEVPLDGQKVISTRWCSQKRLLRERKP